MTKRYDMPVWRVPVAILVGLAAFSLLMFSTISAESTEKQHHDLFHACHSHPDRLNIVDVLDKLETELANLGKPYERFNAPSESIKQLRKWIKKDFPSADLLQAFVVIMDHERTEVIAGRAIAGMNGFFVSVCLRYHLNHAQARILFGKTPADIPEAET